MTKGRGLELGTTGDLLNGTASVSLPSPALLLLGHVVDEVRVGLPVVVVVGGGDFGAVFRRHNPGLPHFGIGVFAETESLCRKNDKKLILVQMTQQFK